MSTRAAGLIFVIIIAAIVVTAAVTWSRLPDPMLAHWNADGVADGTMPRFWGVALFPLIIAGTAGIWWFLPRLDPLRANLEAFRRGWNVVFVALAAFFAYLFGVVIAVNLGTRFNVTMLVLPAAAVLLYVMGMVLPMSKRNWFFGIRTPWTLSSDRVWDRTHWIGGLLFKAAAAVSLVASFFFTGTTAVIVLLVSILGAALGAIVYSWLLWRRLGEPRA
ncbi:MAG: SdpI family protein [Bauldia sp.]|nr:SdpI family protein [Bauldia sp.]